MDTKVVKPQTNGIKEHIDSNVNLYAVFGVFNALTLYASTIQATEDVKSWLGFVFLTLSIILWLTINSSIPETPQVILRVYVFLMDMTTLILIAFWFSTYRYNRNLFLFFICFLCYGYLFYNNFWDRFLRIKYLNRVFSTGKNSALHATILLISMLCSFLTVNYIDKLIEYLKHN